ncbi:hypothetical protein [Marinobacter salsuginis]|uniref:hypothetical protein n=1 Tax=Marinobacter salsuginis TaxID=418719 RepID=UPI001AE05968|nr:hypothetical protein [Marinobacter salsuginis]QTN40980.1 hypothetical protein HZ997_15005 [Marinobacter salsuginis]
MQAVTTNLPLLPSFSLYSPSGQFSKAGDIRRNQEAKVTIKGGLVWLCLLVLPAMQVHGDTLEILYPEQQALYDQAVRQDSIDFLIKAETKDSLMVLAVIYSADHIKGLRRDYTKSAFYSHLAAKRGAEFAPMLHWSACAYLNAQESKERSTLYPDYCEEAISFDALARLLERAQKAANERELAAAKARIRERERRETPARITSPDGWYLVSVNGVSKMSVTLPADQSGRYKFKAVTIETAYPQYFKTGYDYERGWWYPSTQQIYSYHYNIKLGNEHCNGWGDYHWGFQFKPEKVWVGVELMPAFKASWDYPRNRAPQRQCVNETTDRNNCQVVRCAEWRDPEPHRYIVRSKEDAIELYHSISR